MTTSELFEKIYNESHLAATRKHVLMYRNLGFALIPLHLQSKKPVVDWTPYQTTAPTETEIQNWFFAADGNEPRNLGVVLGPVSGNLCTLDIDGESAQARYSKALSDLGYCNNLCGVLLKTFMTRSGSHKGYHVLFRVSDELLQQDDFYRDLVLGKASQPLWQGQGEQHSEIKFLSKGSLAVLAPSAHPSGRCMWYVWNNKPPQVISSAKELSELFSIFSEGDSERAWQKRKRRWRTSKQCGPAALSQTEATKILTEEQLEKLLEATLPEYHVGVRNEKVFALSGELYKRGYSCDTAIDFFTRLCRAASDEEEEQRLETVRRTYCKNAAQVCGLGTLDDFC
jgi:Bifunctional DNA primase/polymerase, N-terminal